jgi:G3E family GTPase
MVNDFGDVNIDKDLVQDQDGRLVELSGGCMCCTIRDDLYGAAKELLASGREFDCILVETSGLAEPLAVARTFLVPELEQQLRLDAVVTVVDAINIEQWLATHAVAADQIRYADLLVVNKLDLVEADGVQALKDRLASLNGHARVLGAMYGDVPHDLLLDIEAHQPRREPGLFTGLPADAGAGDASTDADADAGAPLRRRRGTANPVHSGVVSCSLAEPMELEYDAFDRFVRALPDGVYRAKGTLAIRGIRRRVIFHRVGGRNVLDQGAPWAAGEERSCRMMFLGEDYERDGVLDRLRACAVREEAGCEAA